MQHEHPSADDDPSAERDGDELHRSVASARSRLLGLLPLGIPMPPPGGWAASADLLLHLVDLIRQRRPSRIIELGSGTSTCWLAWALDAFGISGTVVSLEHLPAFRRRTLNHLHTCGVQHLAEVRLAPLTDVHIDGTTYRWYDPAGWTDLRDCDLLLVDGPPGHTAPMARYPAVPLLGPAMAPDAVIVLDDYKRPDERRTVARWLRLHPDWRLQVLEHKKGTAVLSTATPVSAHPA
jgi:predicted O-methyltransferase YrrM